MNNTSKLPGPEKPLSVTGRSYCTREGYQLLRSHLVQHLSELLRQSDIMSLSWRSCCHVFWEMKLRHWADDTMILWNSLVP